MAIERVTYRGSKLFINDQAARRVTAFGSTSSIPREDILEMGNSGYVEILDDTPSVDITVDCNEYGSLRNLLLLSGKATDSTYVDFNNDLDLARVALYTQLKPTVGSTATSWTQYISGAYMTSAAFNYSVDGNGTERYGLQSDSKKWYLNEKYIGYADEVIASGTALSVTCADDVLATTSILGVTKNGQPLVEGTDYTNAAVATGVFSATLTTAATGETFGVRFLTGDSTAQPTWETYTDGTKGAVRKGHIRAYLVTGGAKNDDDGTLGEGTEEKEIPGLQNISVEVSLERTPLMQMGAHLAYARPLNYPIGVNISMDIQQKDMIAFARACGKDDTVDTLSIDQFADTVGLRIKIHDLRDVDTNQTAVKEITVPYLVPSDEAWNLSLDGNATQTFTFRSHQCRVASV